ncbi:putative calcium-binding protein CML25 [Cinnamomum micranthum f. kanehirae]|uniref:Putative calcium-binding protein CML25 n=1 Tax=Cinnamomum micranthum f. kanehirae TaxID=337451 RepID=A0A443PTQ6_9MAGN|nr:putative calcium-binding protein CML25 [Cinnamomum micranthum f. kanehirae]
MDKSLETNSKSPNSCASSSILLQIQDPNDLRMVFEKVDSDGDGKISSSELGSMLQSLGRQGSAEEVELMMRAVDLDGDGCISLGEFLSVTTRERDPGSCLEDLKGAFGVFDRDRNGLISAEELHRVLGEMGESASLADCRVMIDVIDQKGDGAVNFDEFVAMMTRSSP